MLVTIYGSPPPLSGAAMAGSAQSSPKVRTIDDLMICKTVKRNMMIDLIDLIS